MKIKEWGRNFLDLCVIILLIEIPRFFKKVFGRGYKDVCKGGKKDEDSIGRV